MIETYEFKCTIEVGPEDDVQWSHLPEEIQAYLDSAYYENQSKVRKWTVNKLPQPMPTRY